MIKKILNKCKVVLLSILYLLICYILGHFILKNNKSENSYNTYGIYNQYNITFEGNNKTDDNPWGITAGFFEMENEGTCILLYPHNIAIFSVNNDGDDFSFDYTIHPWVKNSSDGAGLNISFVYLNGEVKNYDIYIDSNDDWKTFSVKKDELLNIDRIKIEGNEGKENEDSCDWIVLKFK